MCIQANAAEHVTSVWMAMKDQMELTITICVGSSIVRLFPRFIALLNTQMIFFILR